MPLEEAVGLLRDGAVVAVKGLGGYHLACAAADEAAVARLRARKLRDEKPFAVMTAAPAALADLDEAELALLRSPARPIVLVRRRAGCGGRRLGRAWRPNGWACFCPTRRFTTCSSPTSAARSS